MATEPDDYQTISDNCPGYMVLKAEGIICTRCAGVKRHKRNECLKASTAASRATQAVLETGGAGSDNADSGMESLSDTDSVSSESTARSETSETRVTSAYQSDQGGNHPQDTRHLPRRGFAGPDSHTSIKPGRTNPVSPTHRAERQDPSYKPSQVDGSRSSNRDGQDSDASIRKSKTLSRHDRDPKYGPKSLTWPDMSLSTRLPSTSKNASTKPQNGKTRHGSHSHHPSSQEPTRPSPAIGKLDYSNTTCPSSFGFGRLPSESMG